MTKERNQEKSKTWCQSKHSPLREKEVCGNVKEKPSKLPNCIPIFLGTRSFGVSKIFRSKFWKDTHWSLFIPFRGP